MKKLFYFLTVAAFIFTSMNVIAQDPPKHKFVGSKTCGMCHRKAKDGNQYKAWQKGKHSKAFETLKSKKSVKIAKDMGLKNKPHEAPECLKCHASGYNVDKKMKSRRFKVEDGVQCETCHGAGGDYKSMKIMKDHKKSVANGMKDFKDAKGKIDLAKVEENCRTCHNEESPTFKDHGFDFAKRWEEIKHLIPKK